MRVVRSASRGQRPQRSRASSGRLFNRAADSLFAGQMGAGRREDWTCARPHSSSQRSSQIILLHYDRIYFARRVVGPDTVVRACSAVSWPTYDSLGPHALQLFSTLERGSASDYLRSEHAALCTRGGYSAIRLLASSRNRRRTRCAKTRRRVPFQCGQQVISAGS